MPWGPSYNQKRVLTLSWPGLSLPLALGKKEIFLGNQEGDPSW